MSTYLKKAFTSRMHRPISTIVECGSRDGKDAVELFKAYNPQVIYSFEANPESVPVCEQNVNGYNIKIIPKAVSNMDGRMIFYPVDMERSRDKNIGASSLLMFREQGDLIQKEIEVPSIRLDTFMAEQNIGRVDLLCMDLQGTEYLALEGLGTRLKDVRYIIMEVFFRSAYHGDKLFKEVRMWLEDRDFQFRILDSHTGWFRNALFANKHA